MPRNDSLAPRLHALKNVQTVEYAESQTPQLLKYVALHPSQTVHRPSMTSPFTSASSAASASAFRASDHLPSSQHHLLLACSGSVATIKLPLIINSLTTTNHDPRLLSIRIILTASASAFLAGQSAEQPSVADISRMPSVDGIYHDSDEWAPPWTRGAPILHVELRRWADVLVVAPLSANTMAKVVGGMCDGLLTAVVRAWDTSAEIDAVREVHGAAKGTSGDGRGDEAGRAVNGSGSTSEVLEAKRRKKKKIIIVAPAMNTAMWRHPITRQHVRVLEGDWGVDNDGWIRVVRPVEKELACGDVGDGAMRDWRDIVEIVADELQLRKISTDADENG